MKMMMEMRLGAGTKETQVKPLQEEGIKRSRLYLTRRQFSKRVK
jgi:hypothetical protein